MCPRPLRPPSPPRLNSDVTLTLPLLTSRAPAPAANDSERVADVALCPLEGASARVGDPPAAGLPPAAAAAVVWEGAEGDVAPWSQEATCMRASPPRGRPPVQSPFTADRELPSEGAPAERLLPEVLGRNRCCCRCLPPAPRPAAASALLDSAAAPAAAAATAASALGPRALPELVLAPARRPWEESLLEGLPPRDVFQPAAVEGMRFCERRPQRATVRTCHEDCCPPPAPG